MAKAKLDVPSISPVNHHQWRTLCFHLELDILSISCMSNCSIEQLAGWWDRHLANQPPRANKSAGIQLFQAPSSLAAFHHMCLCNGKCRRYPEVSDRNGTSSCLLSIIARDYRVNPRAFGCSWFTAAANWRLQGPLG